jgi:hypothetical protein
LSTHFAVATTPYAPHLVFVLSFTLSPTHTSRPNSNKVLRFAFFACAPLNPKPLHLGVSANVATPARFIFPLTWDPQPAFFVCLVRLRHSGVNADVGLPSRIFFPLTWATLPAFIPADVGPRSRIFSPLTWDPVPAHFFPLTWDLLPAYYSR